jgi:2-polyprenyl-3-methyl-5-hydroxy-6-metoxy-1,4-benzoquinol methylase
VLAQIAIYGEIMESKSHWEQVYQSKAPETVSWYAPHLETSIKLIQQATTDKQAAIIDVGGGEATLVDDLLDHGYHRMSVLDISQTAIDVARKRLGINGANVAWYCSDITSATLPESYFDVWHDRAVFHFLTNENDRKKYIRQVMRSVKHGGYVIISTFGPEGPDKCSGLDVVKYNADSLHTEFGKNFQLIESSTEIHHTPFGTTQQFLYCYCRME